MDLFLVIFFFIIGLAFFILMNINFSKILKYNEFKKYAWLTGFGWLCAIYKKEEKIQNLDPELQKILKEGRKIALAFYLYVLFVFLVMLFLSTRN